jgi:6,7-dimethyl-8-ribityllumazine synthase
VSGTVEGSPTAEGLHIGVAATIWNQAVTDRLLAGAERRLAALSVSRVTVLRVPGALELPLGARALVDGGCDGVIAIGAIIKGDTDHYEIVVRESSSGIARVSLDTGVPVANSILAVHDYEHAIERAGEDDSNRGAEAAEAVVMMINGLRDLREG